MAKSANYPRKSFKTAIEIAESIDKLGGKCSLELLAESLGKKVSGSFRDGVNASIKHGLISKSKDTLELSSLFTDIKLSYTDEEKNENLKKSFLMANVYGDMLKRFEGKEIPTHILDKMLMKEFGVSESIAKSVGSNLVKGAKSVGLIVDDKVVLGNIVIEREDEPGTQQEENNPKAIQTKEEKKVIDKKENTSKSSQKTQESTDKKIKEHSLNIDDLGKNVNLNINISLTVPETTNEEVYNKFFEAMKKHLLS
ncbi:MAG: hypothetical protein RIB79_11675 [Allomuricauda sp.]|jgi:hypothetical protein